MAAFVPTALGSSRQEREPALPRCDGTASAETGAARFIRGPEGNKEKATVLNPKTMGAAALRLMAALVLPSCPRMGSAAAALCGALAAEPGGRSPSSLRPGSCVVPGGYLAFSPDGARLATGAM